MVQKQIADHHNSIQGSSPVTVTVEYRQPDSDDNINDKGSRDEVTPNSDRHTLSRNGTNQQNTHKPVMHKAGIRMHK